MKNLKFGQMKCFHLQIPPSLFLWGWRWGSVPSCERRTPTTMHDKVPIKIPGLDELWVLLEAGANFVSSAA